MSTLVVTTAADELAPLINAEHDACVRSLQQAADHAFKAGDLLIKAKGLVPHGQWLDWLAEHTDIAERTAQVYMQMAERIEIENRSTCCGLSIREILESIKVPRLADQTGAPATATGDPDEGEDTDDEAVGDGDDGDAPWEPPGRSPEQKVDDVVADTANDFSQHCHWKGVAGADRIAALEKLGKWVQDELKKATTDLLQSQLIRVAPTTINNAPAAPTPAPAEGEPAASAPRVRKQRSDKGQPRGPNKKPTVEPSTPPAPPPAPAARAGNDVNTEASTETMKQNMAELPEDKADDDVRNMPWNPHCTTENKQEAA
jgi:hypothetical protein